MSFFRKKVSARYLVQGALPAVHQAICNYYASQNTQLFPQPQTAPQSVNFGCQTDMSLLSWGESISMALLPADENNTYLDMSSQGTWGAIDFGVNQKNIETLVNALAIYFPITVVNAPARS